MKKMLALMALTILTACDRAERSEFRAERMSRLYQAAMDDYRSGRLDAAVAGFEKVLLKDPGNASARFQLACLQQDAKKDCLAAFCGYREYLRQCPASDKAALAKDRLAKCEKEVAKALAGKHGLLDAGGMAKELDAVRMELKGATARTATAEKELEALRARLTSVLAERDRLLAIVKGAGETTPEKQSVRKAKDLLEEDDEIDRIKVSADVAALKREEGDEVSAGSSLLPRRTASTPIKAEPAEEKPKAKGPSHPETYMVEDGDTLYGIAKRFYGRTSAWKAIRDANKELISMDNRLRAGDTLKLP